MIDGTMYPNNYDDEAKLKHIPVFPKWLNKFEGYKTPEKTITEESDSDEEDYEDGVFSTALVDSPVNPVFINTTESYELEKGSSIEMEFRSKEGSIEFDLAIKKC